MTVTVLLAVFQSGATVSQGHVDPTHHKDLACIFLGGYQSQLRVNSGPPHMLACMCQPALASMPACASVCQPRPRIAVHLGLVPVTVVSYRMALLSGVPWLPGITHDVRDVPLPSSWKQAGLLSLPMRLCGHGGPAELLPVMDRSSLCGQGAVCRGSP